MHSKTLFLFRPIPILLALALLVPLGSHAQTACTYSLGGCQCNCDGLSGSPPQSPAPRSYTSFIVSAYLGAYGRYPSCLEQQGEYWNLVGSSYSSAALLEESKRFVSTLFETQQSYDTPGIDPSGYAQTYEYELRNPGYQTSRMALEAFVGDLYKAFLQRNPDLSGQCFWSNNVCSEGRKKGIEAFKVSIEFGNLAGGLFDAGEPCPPDPGPCRFGICEEQ